MQRLGRRQHPRSWWKCGIRWRYVSTRDRRNIGECTQWWHGIDRWLCSHWRSGFDGWRPIERRYTSGRRLASDGRFATNGRQDIDWWSREHRRAAANGRSIIIHRWHSLDGWYLADGREQIHRRRFFNWGYESYGWGYEHRRDQ